jgi:CHAD domain-containing protein
MATTAKEIEHKYSVPDDFAPDFTEVDGVEVGDTVEIMLDAVYYDTEDLRLAADRMTLRRRIGGDDQGWHLKRPSDDDRSETREPLSDDIPESLAAQVRVHIRHCPLQPVARILTRRLETPIRSSGGEILALLADDTVTASTFEPPAAATPWRELELELAAGDRHLLRMLDGVIRAAGAQPSDAPSKLARVLGPRYPGPQDSDSMPALILYLAAQRAEILRTDPLVRAGDADAVHDMRVAVRRIRATLRTFRSSFDTDANDLREDLHWLAGLLGAVRDCDVLSARMQYSLDDLSPDEAIGPVTRDIHGWLRADARRARGNLASALDGDRYLDILERLDTVIRRPLSSGSSRRLRHRARAAVRRADRLLDRAVTMTDAPGVPMPSPVPADRDAALHEARKAYKRARYGVEAVTPLIGRRGRRLGKRLATLQDVLGDHQDSVVAAGLLRDLGMRAHLDGANAFTYGILYDRETSTAKRHLRRLPLARRRAGSHKLRSRLDH